MKDKDIYLIDSKSPSKHDFKDLKQRVAESLSEEIKNNADVIKVLKSKTCDVIELKAELLKGMLCINLIIMACFLLEEENKGEIHKVLKKK